MKRFLKKFIQYYLKLLTKFVLWRHKPLIIAVSGSTNKTTVKEYILKFLREKYPPHRAGGEKEVRGNPKSYNTEIGLPLAILDLPSGESSALKWLKILARGTWQALNETKFPSKLVLELGVSERGDMQYLLEIVRPKVAIVTNIEGSSTDSGAELDGIFEEMKELALSVPKDGAVILNGDDVRVKNLTQLVRGKKIVFGVDGDFDAKVTNLTSDNQGQSFDFKYTGEVERVRIKKFGRHFVQAWMISKILKGII